MACQKPGKRFDNCTILSQEMLLIFRSTKFFQKLSVWHFALGLNYSQLLGVYHAHYYAYSQLLPCPLQCLHHLAHGLHIIQQRPVQGNSAGQSQIIS